MVMWILYSNLYFRNKYAQLKLFMVYEWFTVVEMETAVKGRLKIKPLNDKVVSLHSLPGILSVKHK